jgi:hypothetical protein
MVRPPAARMNGIFSTVPRTIIQHLDWLRKKRALGQDALLLSPPPSQFARRLALEFARTSGLQVEVVSLTLDTTEADLKTRRDMVKQSIVFSDQAPVRAALQGKMLLLDGLEKCERNVLPTLNNLLENREMNLDDGRLIVSHQRWQDLLKTNTEAGLRRSGVVPAHPNFFVCALSSPSPPYAGRQLDPPLRSRFQVRRLEFPSPAELIGSGFHPEVVKIASAINAACEMNPQMFPRLPDLCAVHISALKRQFPEESLRSLFARSYPWFLDEVPFAHKRTLLNILPATEVTDKAEDTKFLPVPKVFLPRRRTTLLHRIMKDIHAERDVLICGPAGSGKSSELAALDRLGH